MRLVATTLVVLGDGVRILTAQIAFTAAQIHLELQFLYRIAH